MRYTFHDFRRLFITDAIMHGMPPHIAQLVAGHRDINTTLGYKAVYPEEVINGHRAFIARRRLVAVLSGLLSVRTCTRVLGW
jgi:integrase